MLSGSYNHHEKKVKSRGNQADLRQSLDIVGSLGQEFPGMTCNSVGVPVPEEMITSQTGACIVGKAGEKHRKGILFWTRDSCFGILPICPSSNNWMLKRS